VLIIAVATIIVKGIETKSGKVSKNTAISALKIIQKKVVSCENKGLN
jgi:hypothetical protein